MAKEELNKVFDLLYQPKYRKLSPLHWSSYEVVTACVDWLVQSSKTRILDIGSGVGKFCVLGALYADAEFIGVEKRQDLVDEANAVKGLVKADKATFVHANINTVDFRNYDAFYYYNPFYEHAVNYGRIDEKVEFSREKFKAYQRYVYDQLDKCSIGTRVVTYCSSEFELPHPFFLKETKLEGKLNFWIKNKT